MPPLDAPSSFAPNGFGRLNGRPPCCGVCWPGDDGPLPKPPGPPKLPGGGMPLPGRPGVDADGPPPKLPGEGMPPGRPGVYADGSAPKPPGGPMPPGRPGADADGPPPKLPPGEPPPAGAAGIEGEDCVHAEGTGPRMSPDPCDAIFEGGCGMLGMGGAPRVMKDGAAGGRAGAPGDPEPPPMTCKNILASLGSPSHESRASCA